MANIPTTQATTAVAATISISGGYSRLAMTSLTPNQVIYVRGDGPTAVVAADQNFQVSPTPMVTIVPMINGGANTTFSAISSANANLYVFDADDLELFN